MLCTRCPTAAGWVARVEDNKRNSSPAKDLAELHATILPRLIGDSWPQLVIEQWVRGAGQASTRAIRQDVERGHGPGDCQLNFRPVHRYDDVPAVVAGPAVNIWRAATGASTPKRRGRTLVRGRAEWKYVPGLLPATYLANAGFLISLRYKMAARPASLNTGTSSRNGTKSNNNSLVIILVHNHLACLKILSAKGKEHSAVTFTTIHHRLTSSSVLEDPSGIPKDGIILNTILVLFEIWLIPSLSLQQGHV